mmetsp:Transcript_115416/g.337503  ORF Transcript_115416/g.337503 Transcript_115416/m.337503 type:complete len:265 (+) Transcript_115416:1530-2324(+)
MLSLASANGRVQLPLLLHHLQTAVPNLLWEVKSKFLPPLAKWELSPNQELAAAQVHPGHPSQSPPLTVAQAPHHAAALPLTGRNSLPMPGPHERVHRASFPRARMHDPVRCHRHRRQKLLHEDHRSGQGRQCSLVPQVAIHPSPGQVHEVIRVVPRQHLLTAASQLLPSCAASFRRPPSSAEHAGALPPRPVPARVVSCAPWPPVRAASSRWLWLLWTTLRARGRACPRGCWKPLRVCGPRRSHIASPGCGSRPRHNCTALARQ